MPKRAPPIPGEPSAKKRAPHKIPTVEPSVDNLRVLFGRRLKAARLQRAMTLMEMAEATGISNQNISKIEHAKTNLTLATMERLAAVLNLNVIDMFKPLESGDELTSKPSKNKRSKV